MDEDVFEAVVRPAVVPVEEDSVPGVMVGPEVALGGFAFAGIKAADGSLIDFEVVARTHVFGNAPVKGLHHFGKVVVPCAHDVATQMDAVGGAKSPLETVEGLMVAKFLGQQICTE